MREDLFLISARIDAPEIGLTLDLGVFDGISGGNATSEITKYRPAGGREVTRGGHQTHEDVTLTREYELARDHPLYHTLLSLRGAAGMTAAKHPMDSFRRPFGRPIVYRGVLQNVAAPEGDSQSNDVGLLTLVMSVSEIG